MQNDELTPERRKALSRRRELDHRLASPVEKIVQAAQDAQNEMIDELMTLDFALQPFRRALAKRTQRGEDGNSADISPV